MKIEEIVVSKAQKVNIGNYQSVDAFVSLKAFVHEGENADETFAQLIQKADEYLEIQVDRIKLEHNV